MSNDDGITFLELCSSGNLSEVNTMIESSDNPDQIVNYQHSVNGWTGLHWAYKRGHTNVVQSLKEKGAKELANNDGKYPQELAQGKDMTKLEVTSGGNTQTSGFEFIPNYKKNAQFLPTTKNAPQVKASGSELIHRKSSLTCDKMEVQRSTTTSPEIFVLDNSGAVTMSGVARLAFPVHLDPAVPWDYDYVVGELAKKVGIDAENVKYLVVSGYHIVERQNFSVPDLCIKKGSKLEFDFVLNSGDFVCNCWGLSNNRRNEVKHPHITVSSDKKNVLDNISKSQLISFAVVMFVGYPILLSHWF